LDSLEVSWDQLKSTADMGRPHLVILGAGASLAALPDGDRFGNVLPVMNNFADVLRLADGIEASGVVCRERNFEDVYTEVSSNPGLTDLKESIEERVSGYFSVMRLPETPTIYDYLVLSLREKDYIATFNWDPLLYHATLRNHHIAPMPRILYLHGCAVVGYCLEDRIQGQAGTRCQKCGRPYTPTRLLYPVANKDYTADDFIDAQWKSIRFAMEHAWVVTVFGYGAPTSDAAAIDLLGDAWGSPDDRNLEEIEIIDIRPEDDLRTNWNRFIHTHHYRTTDDYFSSLLGHFPRRTCEAMWNQLMEAKFLEYQQVPRFETLDELHEWASEIRSHENR
jgi:hypothetical protein